MQASPILTWLLEWCWHYFRFPINLLNDLNAATQLNKDPFAIGWQLPIAGLWLHLPG